MKGFQNSIRTQGGLLYRGHRLLQLPEADLVAHGFGYTSAEAMVHALERMNSAARPSERPQDELDVLLLHLVPACRDLVRYRQQAGEKFEIKKADPFIEIIEKALETVDKR